LDRAKELSGYAGLEGCWLPGWKTVWLLPELEGCIGCAVPASSLVTATWGLVKPGPVQVVGAPALWTKNPERQ